VQADRFAAWRQHIARGGRRKLSFALAAPAG